MSSAKQELKTRGLWAYAVDHFFAWFNGYPPERCSYTVTPLRIPISAKLERMEFAADLYQPQRFKPLGTILMLSPYGRGFPIAIGARLLAARGYQVLYVSCRGTFGSGGVFDAFRTEAEDGHEVVKWMRQQSWYTGTFAMQGGSYLGYVQWALLCDPPQDFVVAAPIVSPHDFGRHCWRAGAMDLDMVEWADGIALQEQYGLLRRVLFPPRKLVPVLESVPFAENVRNYLGEGSPFLDKILSTPDLSDPHYDAMRYNRALERVEIPTLIITGWYDLFNEQSLEQYARLKERGVNVGLTVGPWTHIQGGLSSKLNQQNFNWAEEHLAGKKDCKRKAAVEYFVTGSKQWKEIDSYPPPTTAKTFFLSNERQLDLESPSGYEATTSFIFDLKQPTPTIGGNGLASGGISDDTALSRRSDVLTFTSAPLTEDVEICGQPKISIAHSSDVPYADLFVRISEVGENGKSHNITDAYKRLDPERDQKVSIDLKMHPCSHRFERGKKIRVYVAGGNFPHFARNLGVQNLDGNAVEMRAVKHSIHHGQVRGSQVTLPITVG